MSGADPEFCSGGGGGGPKILISSKCQYSKQATISPPGKSDFNCSWLIGRRGLDPLSSLWICAWM